MSICLRALFLAATRSDVAIAMYSNTALDLLTKTRRPSTKSTNQTQQQHQWGRAGQAPNNRTTIPTTTTISQQQLRHQHRQHNGNTNNDDAEHGRANTDNNSNNNNSNNNNNNNCNDNNDDNGDDNDDDNDDNTPARRRRFNSWGIGTAAWCNTQRPRTTVQKHTCFPLYFGALAQTSTNYAGGSTKTDLAIHARKLSACNKSRKNKTPQNKTWHFFCRCHFRLVMRNLMLCCG